MAEKYRIIGVPAVAPRPARKRSRVRRFVERASKGVLLVAGAGAVVALLANLEDIKNSKEVKDHWWLLPLGVIAIGYMLRKRGNPYGNAVLAVGGALFASAYALQSKQAQAAPQIPPPPAKPQAQKKLDNTQGPVSPRLFLSPGSNAGWVQLPNGELFQVPVTSLQPRA